LVCNVEKAEDVCAETDVVNLPQLHGRKN